MLSVVPHFNREIAESVRGNGAKIPFVTLITDLADYPPHFWIEKESEYIIAGTNRARQQALTMGHPPDHIFLTSGMLLCRSSTKRRPSIALLKGSGLVSNQIVRPASFCSGATVPM